MRIMNNNYNNNLKSLEIHVLMCVRCNLHCCSWRVWRTATMMSCHFQLGSSPSTHLASCKQIYPFYNKKQISSMLLSWPCLLLCPTRLFQLGGDLEDLESALNKSSQTRPLGSGSCSALIKLLPNNKELLVSHDTWNNYQSMLRIMKKYMFAFNVSPSGSLLMQWSFTVPLIFHCFIDFYFWPFPPFLKFLCRAFHRHQSQRALQGHKTTYKENKM